MKKVAINQSNYIPWKGYFDMIAAVDEFILYDDMQFTKNDWRNRNKIKTPKGLEWLSVPTGQAISRRIRDVELVESRWQRKHWKSIELNYKRAGWFDEVAEIFRPLYLENSYTHLSELNRLFIETICEYLGINTKISDSAEYRLVDDKVDRVIDLCEQSNASTYISGPTARDYLHDSLHLFAEKNIDVVWFNYDNYPEYSQLWDGFHHQVSIIDLLFNCGEQSMKFMKMGQK